jgi:hypothetical protein
MCHSWYINFVYQLLELLPGVVPGFAYVYGNTVQGEKAVKRWSNGVKFCKRGREFWSDVLVRIENSKNPHSNVAKDATLEWATRGHRLTILYYGALFTGAQ